MSRFHLLPAELVAMVCEHVRIIDIPVERAVGRLGLGLARYVMRGVCRWFRDSLPQLGDPVPGATWERLVELVARADLTIPGELQLYVFKSHQTFSFFEHNVFPREVDVHIEHLLNLGIFPLANIYEAWIIHRRPDNHRVITQLRAWSHACTASTREELYRLYIVVRRHYAAQLQAARLGLFLALKSSFPEINPEFLRERIGPYGRALLDILYDFGPLTRYESFICAKPEWKDVMDNWRALCAPSHKANASSPVVLFK